MRIEIVLDTDKVAPNGKPAVFLDAPFEDYPAHCLDLLEHARRVITEEAKKRERSAVVIAKAV